MRERRTVHRMPQVLSGGRIHTEKPRKTRHLGVVVLLIGFSLLTHWFIFQSETFRVTNVELTGTDHPSVVSVADSLKGQSIFAVKATSLEQTVRQAYPPVASLSVIRGIPRTLRLAVTLRTPALKWQLGDTVYILDQRGQVFEQGDKPEYAQLPKVVDTSNNPIEIGQQIVSPSFIAFVHDISKGVTETFQRSHVANEIVETTFHVDVLLEGDVRLKLTTQRPLKEQLESAYAIFQAHPDAKYIDVRVPRWGYWK